MAYRDPRFAWHHLARLAGASAITVSTGSFETDGPKEFLIDGRRSLCQLTGTNPAIDIDRGAFGASVEDVGRLYIPEGHNLDGETIDLISDNNSGFSSPTNLVNSVTVSGTGPISKDFTNPGGTIDEQYFRFTVESFTGTAEIPQIFITSTQSFGASVNFQPDWGDFQDPNLLSFEKTSRDDATLQLAPAQRVWDLEFRAVSGADRTLLIALAEHTATGQRFLMDPPFDDEDPVWCQMDGPMNSSYDFPVPATGTKGQRFSFRVREVVG